MPLFRMQHQFYQHQPLLWIMLAVALVLRPEFATCADSPSPSIISDHSTVQMCVLALSQDHLRAHKAQRLEKAHPLFDKNGALALCCIPYCPTPPWIRIPPLCSQGDVRGHAWYSPALFPLPPPTTFRIPDDRR